MSLAKISNNTKTNSLVRYFMSDIGLLRLFGGMKVDLVYYSLFGQPSRYEAGLWSFLNRFIQKYITLCDKFLFLGFDVIIAEYTI